MNRSPDVLSAVMERERNRTRMRLATMTVGAAALATAGVVAYNLPSPAHKTTSTANSTTTTPAATQPSAVSYSGDDGGDGGRSPTTAPGTSATRAPTHTTSGGS